MSIDRDKTMEIARVLAPRFFDQGHTRVFAAQCCGRVFVSPAKPDTCRTCKGTPGGLWITPNSLCS